MVIQIAQRLNILMDLVNNKEMLIKSQKLTMAILMQENKGDRGIAEVFEHKGKYFAVANCL